MFSQNQIDTVRNLLIETKILPAEFQITKVSLNKFSNILQQTKHCNKALINLQYANHSKLPYPYPFLAKNRKSRWSNGSSMQNFLRKLNELPIAI